MELRESTFIIERQDRALDPKTVISDGLRIGRLPDSDIWLNHPKVSRLHAGINEVEGYFYLINLSASSGTTINGRAIPFDEAEALTEGDEIQIGPYFLFIESIDSDTETLRVRVSLAFAASVGEREPKHKSEVNIQQWTGDRVSGDRLTRSTGPLESGETKRPKGISAPLAEITTALKVFWGKRTREKAGHQSPLHPRTPPRIGKARFNWMPTRDLVRPWPIAIFVWAGISIATLSVIAAVSKKSTFAPAPISAPHMRNALSVTPAIATHSANGSCTSCHALGVSASSKDKMNSNCIGCHRTEAFVGTITEAHREAGLTCISCHSEHGEDGFLPMHQALESCTACHSDQNRNTYNGKHVHTAHGGTFGYPVRDGIWVWKGLDAEELAAKPEVEAFLTKNRVDPGKPQEWRNAQFHGIHLNHIRLVPGVEGTLDDDGVTKTLSCSSCHKTGYMGANIDRDFPRSTCGLCHNAARFNEPKSARNANELPSCTSCHVQHVRDAVWSASFTNAYQQRR